MLRVKDGSAGRALSRSSGVFMTVALALAVVGISALRVPAQQPADILVQVQETNTGSTQQPASVEDLPKDAVEMAPFDLSYVRPDAAGVLAVRPAALLRLPSTKLVAAILKKEIVHFCAVCMLPKDVLPPVESIEQVILEYTFSHGEQAPKGQGLNVTMNMIRSEKNFNWKKLLQTLVPGAEEVHYKGKTYYKGELKTVDGMCDLCYYLPDARTIVLYPEKTMRRVLDSQAERTGFAWSRDWQQVERDLLAIAINIRQVRQLIKKLPEDPVFDPLFEHTSSVVCGVDLKDTCLVQAFATCSDSAAAKALVQKTESLISAGLASLQQAAGGKPSKDKNLFAPQSAIDLLKQAQVTRHGARCSLRMQTKINVDELLNWTTEVHVRE
jgi:hypothetical protein